MTTKLAVVAVGGNALIADADHISTQDQYQVVSQTAEYIVDMIEAGWRVVLTHGNGPQVGFIMRRSELAVAEVPAEPLDQAVADTQGAIGYMFQTALTNALRKRKINKQVVTIVTQTLVSKEDSAFANPTKPIGSFMSEAVATQLKNELGWSIMEDSGRGWRRTVPSPQPIAIQELDIIQDLLAKDRMVVTCGGGGIPVAYNKQQELVGVEAVIDKDTASSLLAQQLQADLFLIPTGVEQVAINFGTPEQENLARLSIEQADQYAQSGEFGKGSMEPKVKAIVNYLKAVPNGKGLITLPSKIKEALKEETGTWIY